MQYPALPPVRFALAFLPTPYLFLAIVAEYDNTTVHPNACSGMQTETTRASTLHIGWMAILPLGLHSKLQGGLADVS